MRGVSGGVRVSANRRVLWELYVGRSRSARFTDGVGRGTLGVRDPRKSSRSEGPEKTSGDEVPHLSRCVKIIRNQKKKKGHR